MVYFDTLYTQGVMIVKLTTVTVWSLTKLKVSFRHILQQVFNNSTRVLNMLLKIQVKIAQVLPLNYNEAQ